MNSTEKEREGGRCPVVGFVVGLRRPRYGSNGVRGMGRNQVTMHGVRVYELEEKEKEKKMMMFKREYRGKVSSGGDENEQRSQQVK